jgi:superfamily II RNA helicase
MKQQDDRVYAKKEVRVTASRINKNELGLMGSFTGMVKLLEDFKFIKDDSLTLKGRIAREVDIYVAQVIIEGVLDPLNFAEVAALMSAFVCDYKPRPGRGEDISWSPFSKEDSYTDELEKALQRTHHIVARIVKYETDHEAFLNPLPEEQHLLSIINYHLADTVYKWADGFNFVEAKEDSKAPEGIIVRTIMRLNMLLGNVKNTCRIMGSSDLEAKVDQAIESIKRDIVFCQSLYLSA